MNRKDQQKEGRPLFNVNCCCFSFLFLVFIGGVIVCFTKLLSIYVGSYVSYNTPLLHEDDNVKGRNYATNLLDLFKIDNVFHIFRDLSCEFKLCGKARELVSASLYVNISFSPFDDGIGWYEILSSEKDTH